jgi:hypothetical protein
LELVASPSVGGTLHITSWNNRTAEGLTKLSETILILLTGSAHTDACLSAQSHDEYVFLLSLFVMSNLFIRIKRARENHKPVLHCAILNVLS